MFEVFWEVREKNVPSKGAQRTAMEVDENALILVFFCLFYSYLLF